MFSPAVAAELRGLGHDVIAVADQPELRSKSDEEVLTENVKDFRPILLRALQGGLAACLRAAVHQQPHLSQVEEEPWASDPPA